MSEQFWQQIENDDAMGALPPESRSVVVVSSQDCGADQIKTIGTESARVLQAGGLLFVYGAPRELPHWGEWLDRFEDLSSRLVFKYWIALDLDDAPHDGFLKATHRGLLMFLKQPLSRRTPLTPPLKTADVKVPHQFCAACGKTLKDWGGKKHLMNPKGAALSDVWRDLPRIELTDHIAPAPVLERIRTLTERDGARGLHVIVRADESARAQLKSNPHKSATGSNNGVLIERDQVVLGDCIEFLDQISKRHPEGVFDLAFADPPYNLAKGYGNYQDDRADRHYLEWCNQWLDGMARTLKPGGSLFVLNLPKWAVHHAAFLNSRLAFRHWIAWDALSDPRGRLMPAHYALLYYTKPGGAPVFNYARANNHKTTDAVADPDAPKYCLRAACVRDRKALGDDDKVELSDIWFDIHRIKHKRDRDAHPCQLPDKLMDRIIRLTTNPGALVFDPFCGAGTTAIAARKLGRRFITTECDPKYVRITNEKLAAMKEHADLFGEFIVPRAATTKQRSFLTKKYVETFLQELTRKLNRVPTEAEIHEADGEMLAAIDRIYPNRGAALKRCKVALV